MVSVFALGGCSVEGPAGACDEQRSGVSAKPGNSVRAPRPRPALYGRLHCHHRTRRRPVRRALPRARHRWPGRYCRDRASQSGRKGRIRPCFAEIARARQASDSGSCEELPCTFSPKQGTAHQQLPRASALANTPTASIAAGRRHARRSWPRPKRVFPMARRSAVHRVRLPIRRAAERPRSCPCPAVSALPAQMRYLRMGQ